MKWSFPTTVHGNLHSPVKFKWHVMVKKCDKTVSQITSELTKLPDSSVPWLGHVGFSLKLVGMFPSCYKWIWWRADERKVESGAFPSPGLHIEWAIPYILFISAASRALKHMRFNGFTRRTWHFSRWVDFFRCTLVCYEWMRRLQIPLLCPYIPPELSWISQSENTNSFLPFTVNALSSNIFKL